MTMSLLVPTRKQDPSMTQAGREQWLEGCLAPAWPLLSRCLAVPLHLHRLLHTALAFASAFSPFISSLLSCFCLLQIKEPWMRRREGKSNSNTLMGLSVKGFEYA